MKKSVKLFLSRIMCFLMALNVLNLSVDSPDGLPDFIPEDLSFNEMESVTEIVLEQVLDYKNFIVEVDENDTEESEGIPSLKKCFSIEYLIENIEYTTLDFKGFTQLQVFYLSSFRNQYKPDLNPPPPKSL